MKQQPPDQNKPRISFSAARWADVRQNYADWWAGRLDRPLIAATLDVAGQDGPRPDIPLYAFQAFHGLDTPVERIVDAWQWQLEGQRYLGDAFPYVQPNFGPGVVAAFMGCELRCSAENATVWFHPREERTAKNLVLALDDAEPWYRRVQDLAGAADARFDGLVQTGMTDLGGTLDILSSFRPGEQLMLDLYDCPDEVERLTWQAHACWWECFERLRGCMPHNPGYISWTPIFSEEPYYMLQCDFCYMLGPNMFDRFVKPELAASCRRLKNAFYHLDGPGQLPHLDSLLEIPELKGVQWVPGAGQPDVTHWPEVYRRIRAAGKLIQVYAGQSARGWEALDVLADQLGGAKGIVMIGGCRIEQEPVLRRVLGRYGGV